MKENKDNLAIVQLQQQKQDYQVQQGYYSSPEWNTTTKYNKKFQKPQAVDSSIHGTLLTKSNILNQILTESQTSNIVKRLNLKGEFISNYFMFSYLLMYFISANCIFLKEELHEQISENKKSIQIQENQPLDYPYLLVDVLLEEQDNSFLVLYFDTNDQSYTQISSEQDGRLDRHLIIHNQYNEESQIQIFSNKKTQYQIKVTPIVNDFCFNNCNDHGICKNSNCECYEGYLGKDCHLPVILVNSSIQNILLVSQIEQYYMVNLEEKEQQAELYLSFQVERQAELIIKCYDDIEFFQEIYEEEELKIVKVQLSRNEKLNAKNFLFFKIEKYSYYNQNLRNLGDQNNENSDDESNDSLAEKVGAIIGAIMGLVTAGGCCFFFCKRANVQINCG